MSGYIYGGGLCLIIWIQCSKANFRSITDRSVTSRRLRVDRGRLYTPQCCCMIVLFTLGSSVFALSSRRSPSFLLVPINKHHILSPFNPGLIPWRRLSRFLIFFGISQATPFFRFVAPSFTLACALLNRSSGIFNYNPCPVDRPRRLSILFKAHCRLVAYPSSRCHRCRDPSFTRKRWLARDQCLANGFTLTESALRLERRGGG